MKSKYTKRLLGLGGALALLVIAPLSRAENKTTLRFGHFPNVTHAQGVIAHGLSRQGKGWFEQRLGPGIEIQWFTYNAGPSAMEAIFAGSLDLTYVGQGPALNAYLKSEGEEIRVLAGAATGGAALVVRPASAIKTAADLRGKTIATPQLGNTQDISCRAWLKAQGFPRHADRRRCARAAGSEPRSIGGLPTGPSRGSLDGRAVGYASFCARLAGRCFSMTNKCRPLGWFRARNFSPSTATWRNESRRRTRN